MQNRLNAHANTFLLGGEAVNATSYLVEEAGVKLEMIANIGSSSSCTLTHAVEIEKISPAPISM